MNNKAFYNKKRVVDIFGAMDCLEKPEEVILERLKGKLGSMNMLDIGVGGGRTTKYFAPLVNNYTGIDYAQSMVNICKKRFKDKYCFAECDARNMDKFKDNFFDFVLFSFNGLDDVSYEDRMAILKQINRVLKKDGYFCFSSHNLNWEGLSSRYGFGLDNSRSLSLIKKIYTPANRIFFRLLNMGFSMPQMLDTMKKKGYGYLYEGVYGGKAGVFYLSYRRQLEQLASSGFKNICSYSWSGIETDNGSELNNGAWIYYLCQANK